MFETQLIRDVANRTRHYVYHMKVKVNYWFVFLSVILITSSNIGCKKYEDGPLLSLKSKKARLVGKWMELPRDGTPLENQPYREFKSNGDYIGTVVFTTQNIPDQVSTGTWYFNDEKTKIMILYSGAGSGLGDEIRRLTSNELWIYEYGWKGAPDWISNWEKQ